MTTAQQVGHSAQTLDWFIKGAPKGFDFDFEKHAKGIAGRNGFFPVCSQAFAKGGLFQQAATDTMWSGG